MFLPVIIIPEALFYFLTFLSTVNMASLRFIAPPKILGPPLDTKAPGPPLIYLLGPLAISDPPYQCVGPPNTCVVLNQFNLLPANTSV